MARHVGEWSARIAGLLPQRPYPSFARRAAVLAGLDPDPLGGIPELRHLVPHVRDYQSFATKRTTNPPITSLIIAVAGEFNARIDDFARKSGPAPKSVLRSMLSGADELFKPVIRALVEAVKPGKATLGAFSGHRS